MDWLTESDDAILGNAIADIKMLMQSIKNPSKNTVAILYRYDIPTSVQAG
ncbi:hypothetical protein J694_3155 [Acinetobacter sp. 1281984]|nr:hypothetical protein J627_2900 [Acinetobacter sp. 1245593]EXR26783.1 hypothetical protein J694_3155 [Acinetobacter sp. 1281984]